MGKKDKKTAKSTSVTQSLMEGVSNAKVVFTIENQVKLPSTPAGEYSVDCVSGKITIKKAETSGRISWFLNDEKITRSNLYNLTRTAEKPGKPDEDKGKDEKPGKKSKKDKKSTKDKNAEDSSDDSDNEVKGDDAEVIEQAQLDTVYKKKQIKNVLVECSGLKKGVIKKVVASIEEKKISGSDLLPILDEVCREETPFEVLKAIFDGLNN